MKKDIILTIFSIIVLSITFTTLENSFAEQLEIEIKYTDGDRVDYNEVNILVYQDFEKSTYLEKELQSNPDYIDVEKNHRYKIEVYANDIFADVEYIQLGNKDDKININIPLSGGLQFEVYYNDNENPIKDATVILKSNENKEIGRSITNDLGETTRYWIQSTTRTDDHYVADVYLNNLFLTTMSNIKVEPGVSKNQRIIVDIPEIIEELISITLYDGNKKITSKDGIFEVILTNLQDHSEISSNVNFRGDAQFSNLKAGTYLIKVKTEEATESILWGETDIHIIGDLNKFSIFKKSKEVYKQQKPFLECDCISFRLDDIQDYWLSDTQMEIIELFSEKNVPLSIGVIGNLIGEDENLINTIKNNLKSQNIEIINHSWNNDALPIVTKTIQEQYILDTNDKIKELFDVTPTGFIPPQNLYNEDTVEILKNNGFSHLISHISENPKTSIENSFHIIPAVIETAILIDNATKWELNKNEFIINKIQESIQNNGYAIIMMHPQEFALNDHGEYDVPNQESLNQLKELVESVKAMDSEIVKISQISDKVIDANQSVTDIQSEEILNPDEISLESKKDTCNCVSFRLDDVQDYWLNEVQIGIMGVFEKNNVPITVGIIADSFGNDQKIVDYVKMNVDKNGGNLEIATRGIGLSPYTNFIKSEQNENLSESIKIIETSTGITPHVLIPPDNKFNSDTMEILEENKITHISSSMINGDTPPFELKDSDIYRFPQITSTGNYNPSKNLFEWVPSDQIFTESIQSINNYGFAVISIHPQEFSTVVNSTYVNSINKDQIQEMEQLIKNFNSKGIKIVAIGEINENLVILVPEWIKNNAGWWADGSIDDKTFVQGIEYLVKEELVKVSEKSKTTKTEQNIPEWIKNNAGWWADGSIDDKTFVQGIEYLVKSGIITY